MTSPTPFRAVDMRLIDDLFGMGGGYVLDFTDRTFAEFFHDDIGINIDDSKYQIEGTSKAKRLRYFLRISSAELRIRTLTRYGSIERQIGDVKKSMNQFQMQHLNSVS